MAKAALVVMAAGIGSRFGGGIKQLEPVGPNGELIIDYSIYDGMAAGFDKIVFVIRKDLEADFKAAIGDRIARKIEVQYAYQEIDDVPSQYASKAAVRAKPWGTGQAILCCKEWLQEPFLVINADDYYGQEAYQKAYQQLLADRDTNGREFMSMVGFILKNTLSENGTVTRGICRVDDAGMLSEVEETYEIRKSGGVAKGVQDGKLRELSLDSLVSMNMWGMYPEFMEVLEQGFDQFLSQWDEGAEKNEFLLPILIGELLKEDRIRVKVLHSNDHWFGVTYQEDKELVVESIRELVAAGLYPQSLY